MSRTSRCGDSSPPRPAGRCSTSVPEPAVSTLELARAGLSVMALDRDAGCCSRCCASAPATWTCARWWPTPGTFWLGARFALCIVPMQTIQLLGGPRRAPAFLACAVRQLQAGAVDGGGDRRGAGVLRDRRGRPRSRCPTSREVDGVVYSSQPTAVRAEGDGFVLERRRETVTADGAAVDRAQPDPPRRLTPRRSRPRPRRPGCDRRPRVDRRDRRLRRQRRW